jgi:ubiquinone/menaquinone biosynthesis C-methylase UbiE
MKCQPPLPLVTPYLGGPLAGCGLMPQRLTSAAAKIAHWTIAQVGDGQTSSWRRDGVQEDNFQKIGILIMSTAQAIETNNQYIDFWNAILVPKFNAWRHILAGGLQLHSAKMFPALPLHSGDSVLDVGCGWGDTAIELARRVGPAGSVVGLDCCGAFLDVGRADARAAGLTNLTFLEADVQAYPFKPVHDFCFSRFGTQFFENPVAGLRNMRLALRPGGLMTMIVWRSRADNPWLTLSKEILLRYLPPVKEDAATCGPGPFSMTDPEAVTEQLRIAGYSDARFERIDANVLVGRDLNEAVAFQLAIGPAGEVYREAGKEAERLHDNLVVALRDELRKFVHPEGVMMNSSSWMVTAQNPRLSLAPGK